MRGQWRDRDADDGARASDPVQLAEVIAHNADGSSTVASPDGNQYRVRGQDVAVGSNAYIQSGRILEEAPERTARAYMVQPILDSMNRAWREE